jgi:hypothetical protein
MAQHELEILSVGCDPAVSPFIDQTLAIEQRLMQPQQRFG